LNEEKGDFETELGTVTNLGDKFKIGFLSLKFGFNANLVKTLNY